MVRHRVYGDVMEIMVYKMSWSGLTAWLTLCYSRTYLQRCFNNLGYFNAQLLTRWIYKKESVITVWGWNAIEENIIRASSYKPKFKKILPFHYVTQKQLRINKEAYLS